MRQAGVDGGGRAVIDAILAETRGFLLGTGRVVERFLDTHGGFDHGFYRLDTDQGTLELRLLNEFLTADRNGVRVNTFPDTLAVLDAGTGLPLKSVDVYPGRSVAVLHVPFDKLPLGGRPPGPGGPGRPRGPDGPGLPEAPPRGLAVTRSPLVLDGHSLTRAEAQAFLAGKTGPVALDPAARARIDEVRGLVEGWLADGWVVYGVTTGLGRLKDWTVGLDDQEAFQIKILESHAAGWGAWVDPAVARLALLLRAHVWARGHSGVRSVWADRVLAFLNAGLAPAVPEIGSLGVGDLQALAHAGLALVGHPRGQVWTGAAGAQPARPLLQALGLGPLALGAKEALSLVGGSAFLLAGTIHLLARARRLQQAAEAATALTLEALRGVADAWDPRVHAARGSSAQARAATRVRAWIGGSQWMTDAGRLRWGESLPRVQDAVSLRAAAAVFGAFDRVVDFAERAVDEELSSTSDNPLIFGEGDGAEVLGGGNFHGAELAYALDFLAIAFADLGALSERHSARLLDPFQNYGLPPALAGGEPGLNTGLTLIQATATALVAELRVTSTPVTGSTIPCKSGQEDHHSLGPTALSKARRALDHLEVIVAVELLCAHRAAVLASDRLAPLVPGRGTARLLALLSSLIPPPGDDTGFRDQLDSVLALLRSGEALEPSQLPGEFS